MHFIIRHTWQIFKSSYKKFEHFHEQMYLYHYTYIHVGETLENPRTPSNARRLSSLSGASSMHGTVWPRCPSKGTLNVKIRTDRQRLGRTKREKGEKERRAISCVAHLYRGEGLAWASHSNVKPCPWTFANPSNFDLGGNRGGLLPTGSRRQSQRDVSSASSHRARHSTGIDIFTFLSRALRGSHRP